MKNILSVLILLAFAIHTNAQEVEGKAGKIWYSNDHLYVNIVDKGILVIDNNNPKKPEKLGFIQIPGNVDLAVKGEVLYANNYDDFIALDIKNLEKINEKSVLKRFDAVFTQFKEKKDKEDIKWIKPSPNNWVASSSGMISTSKGGSMACFALVNDYLYTLTPNAIETFEVKKTDHPKRAGKTRISGDTYETIFSNGENLFVGAQGGMYIFGLDNPNEPKPIGEYHHLQSCDPVVVEGDLAYVTLRDGNICGRNEAINRLEIVDISNPSNPQRVSSNPLTNPRGLAVDKSYVFVCDGDEGLKIIDANNPRNVRLVETYNDISTAYDIINIPSKKLLILVGGESVIQYDYSSIQQLKQLSLVKTNL
jgi:hypothetical protein